MWDKVYGCIYEFVKEIPDSPLSVKLIAETSDCTEEEVKIAFKHLKMKGFLKRKHYFTHVYRLTDEGFNELRKVVETKRI